MKLILSIFLSLLSLNLFAADGALGTASGTTTVGTIPAGNLPALGVAYPNALTNNSTVAWTNTDNITALTFSGAGSGQGILSLSNAAATGLTVILGPSNAFANVAYFSNSIVAPFWKDPTNAPTSNDVVTATSTSGDTAWKAVAASSSQPIVFACMLSSSTMSANTAYATPIVGGSGAIQFVGFSAANERPLRIVMPRAGYFSNCFYHLSPIATGNPVPTGTNYVFSFYTNGVLASSFLQTFVGDGSTFKTNSGTKSISLASGDEVSLSISNATSTSVLCGFSWILQYYP